MELSARMNMVVGLVSPCHSLADVGCDHGYVSIAMIRRGLAKKVIAMDVRSGPLQRAIDHVAACGLETVIHCRLSDGLEQLHQGEADAVVIAGMGGLLMRRLLMADPDKTKSISQLILQPQSDIDSVRRCVHELGYRIVEEQCLYEEDKFYVAMKAIPGEEQAYTELEYYYGRCLLRDKSQAFLQRLDQEEAKAAELMENLLKTDTPKARERREQLEVRIKEIQQARNYMEA